MLFYRDGESAISAGRRACALDPNNADARLFLSLSLAACGHGEEAMRYIEAGMRLHPHPSSFYLYALGKCLFALGRYEEAIEAQRRGIEVNVHFIPNHYDLAITLGVCGRVEEGRTEAAIVKADWPDVSKIFFLDPRLAAEYERGKKVAGLWPSGRPEMADAGPAT
jgi:tetratricopeptide (TPR) repeat protein